jgi:flagellar biosynthetic protein FliO
VPVDRRPDAPSARRPGWAWLALLLAFVSLVLSAPAFAAEKPSATHSKAEEIVPEIVKDTTPLSLEVTGKTTRESAPTSNTTGAIVRMIVGLAVVLGVVYGVYWLLKTYARSKGGAVVSDERMRVVATTSLGPNRALHLVRIGDELVLVGSSEQGVTPVKTWSADESRRVQTSLELRAEGGPFHAVDAAAGFRARFVDELRKKTTRR